MTDEACDWPVDGVAPVVAPILLTLSDDELRTILVASKTYEYTHRSKIYGLLAPALTCRRFLGVIRGMSESLNLQTPFFTVCSSMSLLRWAISIGCPYPLEIEAPALLAHAARFGSIEVAQYALQIGCAWDSIELQGVG